MKKRSLWYTLLYATVHFIKYPWNTSMRTSKFFFKSFYFIHFKCKLITDWRTYWIVNWILLFILRNLSKFHKYIELWQGKPKCFPFQPSTKTDQSVSFSPYWSWASMNWIVFSKSKTKWFIWFTIFQIIFFRNIK